MKGYNWCPVGCGKRVYHIRTIGSTAPGRNKREGVYKCLSCGALFRKEELG